MRENLVQVLHQGAVQSRVLLGDGLVKLLFGQQQGIAGLSQMGIGLEIAPVVHSAVGWCLAAGKSWPQSSLLSADAALDQGVVSLQGADQAALARLWRSAYPG